VEYDEKAERLEREADRLEEHSEELGERIEDVRNDWESKESDASVPGAQPEPGEDEEDGESV
jgi:chaperonin cofactor prefoldin